MQPFKKERERGGSGSSTSGVAAVLNAGTSSGATGAITSFGSGLLNFGMRNFIKRKKSAPEAQDLKRAINLHHHAHHAKNNEYEDEDDETLHYDYSPKMSAHSASSPLNSYYVYINENCCVEIHASQHNSIVQNILIQVGFH